MVPMSFSRVSVASETYCVLTHGSDAGEKLKGSKGQASVSRGRDFLDIQLGKGHQKPVSKAKDETPGIKSSDVRSCLA